MDGRRPPTWFWIQRIDLGFMFNFSRKLDVEVDDFTSTSYLKWPAIEFTFSFENYFSVSTNLFNTISFEHRHL